MYLPLLEQLLMALCILWPAVADVHECGELFVEIAGRDPVGERSLAVYFDTELWYWERYCCT